MSHNLERARECECVCVTGCVHACLSERERQKEKPKLQSNEMENFVFQNSNELF